MPDDTTGLVGWIAGTGNRSLLAGLADYEIDSAPAALRFEMIGGALTNGALWPGASAGSSALAVADFDGDGDLDLFVGGRAGAGALSRGRAKQDFSLRERTPGIGSGEHEARLARPGS